MSLAPYMVGADITALTGEADPTEGLGEWGGGWGSQRGAG